MLARRVGFALLLVSLFCATLPALADSTARIVRLSYLDGDVQIDRGNGSGLERAVLNMPVVQGTQLSTAGDGSAEVEFEDGATLRLVPDTAVEFRTLSLRSSGERVSSIELARGTAYLEATRKKDDFSITAGGQEITLAHDAHVRIQRSGAHITLAVFKGEVDVQNPTGSVRVKKDETLNLNLNDPSQYELDKGIETGSYDAWNQQRDDYRKTYAARHHDRYNSNYSYGWSDLNYFGSFNQYGSYGSLWRPWGIGPGWDPFADGAWVFYPGYGYMWVSAYPWGWMPYRYGTWIFVPGYGWAWRPGTVWTTWYATPVIYGAPVGYVAPKPPAATSTRPGTVVVGGGPLTGVRNPRYRQWLKDPDNPNATQPKGGVTPVPTATTSSAAVSQKTSTTSTATTAAPTTKTTTPHDHRDARHSTPPSRPPKSETPQVSTPPSANTSQSPGVDSTRSAAPPSGAKAPKKLPPPPK
ncbi:MAG TPA: FecR family protein [Terriglobales bacterium]|nr:FecR family protein [Terriglobales bacterium]